VNRLVLANSSYPSHVTNEGEQLQSGLAHSGWTLTGYGYGDGCVDVPKLILRHRPDMVFIQDKRDWDRANPGGSFGNEKLHFEQIKTLANRPDILKVGVVKDAGSMSEYQEASIDEIEADAVVVYYHERSVLKQSRWLNHYPLIRTYHSVDADVCQGIDLTQPRRRGIVTGASNSKVYPLRASAFAYHKALRIDAARHPGYGCRGCHTNEYLVATRGLQSPRRDRQPVRFRPAKDH
jgi:hypothetical protein